MKMSASQFMDKQIMDLTASGSSKTSGGKDDLFLDLVNSRIRVEQDDSAVADDNDHRLGTLHADYSHNNSVYADEGPEEIVPSYDFHPTLLRNAGSPPSRAWASADSKSTKNYSSLDSVDPVKGGRELIRSSVDMADIVTEVDRAMKKHADDLLHALEVVSARLTQLETRIRNMENSVDDVKLAVGDSHGSTDGKMRQLENILREVRTDVLVIKDRQEIIEAQLQLAKVQVPKSDQSHADEEAAVSGVPHNSEPTTQQQFPPSVSFPQSITPLPLGHQNFPPLGPQHNFPSPHQPNLPPLAPQQNLPPPSLHQNFAPPAPQQNFAPPPATQQNFPPSTQQNIPAPTPQQNFPPPTPQQNFPPSTQQNFPNTQPSFPYNSQQNLPNTPPQNFSASSTLPNQFSLSQVHPPPGGNAEKINQQHHPPAVPPHQPYPPVPPSMYPPGPPSVYPQQPHSHPLPGNISGDARYSSSTNYPPNVIQASSQPPSGPPSDLYYGMHNTYEPQSSRSGPLVPAGFTGRAGQADSFSYGSPSQYGGTPATKPPQLPTARILPQALPTASSIENSSSSGTANRVPIDDVVDRVANMGFPRDQVRATVQKLTEDGQSVELNVVLDRLMNGGDTQSRRGWFDRT